MTKEVRGSRAEGQGAGPDLLAIYGELDTMHAWRGWHWWPDADPFEVVVGSILVQNTSWSNVERALDRLRAASALAPAAMAALADDELEELVRPSGQYRQKAKKLRAFLATADTSGGFEALLALPAPDLRAACLATWGIGPETADCIVAYASRQPAMVVDAYTARLFSRLGLGPGESAGYDAWQRWMVEGLRTEDSRLRALSTQHSALRTEDSGLRALSTQHSALRTLYCRYHALVVMHCKHTCRKLAPRCGECTLAARCPAAKP